MKNQTPIDSLVMEKLRILFNAEKQLVNYLQVIKHKSQAPALQSLLGMLIEVSLSRVSEFNHLFKHLGIQKEGVTCEAMNGFIRENLSLISLNNDIRANEHAIINFLQQVNQYKSIAYTWLLSHMSDHPQLIQAVSMIHEILHEEEHIALQINEVENKLIFLKHSREQLVTY